MAGPIVQRIPPPVRLRLHYARRAVTVAFHRLSRHSPAPALPLHPDAERLDHLFAGSPRAFEELVLPYRREFRWFLGRVYNANFESVDVELYHSVIRRYRPRLIVEVGSGVSTGFAREAMDKSGGGRIVSIDPEPRRPLPAHVEHLARPVEEVDPALFAELRANDVLFIDSSHTTEEARYHTEAILPNLAPGVLVHHHDVLFPYVKYHLDDPVAYGEPDVVLAFYEREQERFEVLVSAAYVRWRRPELLRRLVPSFRWLPARVPGSLWTRRIEPSRDTAPPAGPP